MPEYGCASVGANCGEDGPNLGTALNTWFGVWGSAYGSGVRCAPKIPHPSRGAWPCNSLPPL